MPISTEAPPKARRAPPGFTPALWEQFCTDGYLIFEDVLDADTIAATIAAIDQVASAAGHDGTRAFRRDRIATLDPFFAQYLNHDSHIGFAYDIYGELTKVHLASLQIRPHGGGYNQWHPDGARALPFGVFSPELPLQIKVSYWLTDLPEPGMGNLVVLPGSHRQQVMDAYDTHESVKGEHILCPRAGTMTIMHSSIWHRVENNDSDVERKNIFLAYCPSWIVSEDRHHDHDREEQLAALSREQRILLRSYPDKPYTNTKPPAADFPLFLPRDPDADPNPEGYRPHVQAHRRKYRTWVERYQNGEFS